MKIVLQADSPEMLLNFSQFVTGFIEKCRQHHSLILKLLKKPFLFDKALSEVTPALLFKIVGFQVEPNNQNKQSLEKNNPGSDEPSPEPIPLPYLTYQGEYRYQLILEAGICPLSKDAPYQVSQILINAVASMIRMYMHREGYESMDGYDLSERWCAKLNQPDAAYQNVKGMLVQTLTYACEQVYKKAQESINALDEALRNHHWKVFRRLRQYLYASYPNNQTLPWIQEEILGYNYHSESTYDYEFQLMVRKSSEHFGSNLLAGDEKKSIFNAILAGPSQEEYIKWMGNKYSVESFQRRQYYFHHVQPRPFYKILSHDERKYFDELEDGKSDEIITDDNYLPYQIRSRCSVVSYQSPKSAEELECLEDEGLLVYLNNWDKEKKWETVIQEDGRAHWIELNIDGLAREFQSLFKEKIIPDNQRLTFWLENPNRIDRPIYIAAMIDSISEIVKEKNFSYLDRWIKFCAWVLSHSDAAQMEEQPEAINKYRDGYYWSRSRRAVVDFVDTCIKQNTDVPISARQGLGNLLRLVCNQPDCRLDHDLKVVRNRSLITQAINNTRSRALDSLVDFGFWIRRNLPEDPLPEVIDIIATRIAEDAVIPLTQPEHAMMGMHFRNFCILNKDWAIQQREIFFRRQINLFGKLLLAATSTLITLPK